jgi:hypothetical protein
MALYKNSAFLGTSTSDAFDLIHKIDDVAPHAGIYRCVDCGHEIGIAQGHKFPPHPHEHTRPRWQLIVYAQHK